MLAAGTCGTWPPALEVLGRLLSPQGRTSQGLQSGSYGDRDMSLEKEGSRSVHDSMSPCEDTECPS